MIKKLLLKFGFKEVNIFFFDSGRNCLSFILETIKLKNLHSSKHEVLVPSFTCEIVPIHILKSKYTPIYYDLCPDTKNILKTIKKKVSNKTKAIIYQHSFGRHDDISKLSQFCKKKKIFLIEDKALCFLSKKKKLKELQGDFAYYSFEVSKTISTRMGGMVISKNDKKYDFAYQNNFCHNFISDLQTILSVITFNIGGYLGFGVRKILIILNLLKRSINKQDLIYNNKFSEAYYDLTNLQKCYIIFQLKKLINKKKICNKNIQFWKNVLPDLKVENINKYSFYYPVRLSYNGDRASKLKKNIRTLGLIQEPWFENGIGSQNFESFKIGFNLKNFPVTKKFCENYVNLPTLVNLSESFKYNVKLELNT